VKSVLIKLHQVFAEDRLDDTEYIRNVKAVLEAAEMFLQANNEISSEPHKLNQSLYEFSKALWLEHLEKVRSRESDSRDEDTVSEDDGYDDYYYDYIYNNGVYPR
ncbi:hypothetical protein QUF72_18835, partial [Desulfobacterales bacterium HSG2]|nr:hypothetical protein [Desulfobacterales bacterium HSG2]